MASFATCSSCSAKSPSSASSCAPRMADGRLFTDYRPRCDANAALQAPMSGNHDYRQHLIQNGAAIIESQRAAAAAASACAPCAKPSTMIPEVDRFVCDKVSCARVAVPGATAALGVGTGRAYGGGGSAPPAPPAAF